MQSWLVVFCRVDALGAVLPLRPGGIAYLGVAPRFFGLGVDYVSNVCNDVYMNTNDTTTIKFRKIARSVYGTGIVRPAIGMGWGDETVEIVIVKCDGWWWEREMLVDEYEGVDFTDYAGEGYPTLTAAKQAMSGK